MHMILSMAPLLALSSLDVWEREASSRNSTGEFYLSTQGVTVSEAVLGMKGKLAIEKHGMLRIDGLVAKTACERMLKKVEEVRPMSTLGPRHHNVAVAVDRAVEGVYTSVIDKIYPVIRDLVTESGVLVAMGIMVNDPGAKYQTWHADTVPDPRSAKLFTFFVALEDITDDMGPTGLVGGSHRQPFINSCSEEIRATKRAPCHSLIDAHPKLAATLSQGDVLIMDSTIYHRANENTSGKRRRYFYFSMTSPGKLPVGSTYTLLDGYKTAQLTLKNYLSWARTRPGAGI
eukprot:TRINITY_DN460_c2_g1_i1.p1 TRINITY_DN460_c2_g1~~TRINITY_DN460_c2_g1_i1.p1  ORF type:complete len:306 (+),score=33.31 TRINITY_DN460_c2_g1_i1:57-920(+)